jgi:2-octaprenyl-6-methoxyphenol hydroxylase
MSLRDMAALLDLAKARPDGLGDADMLMAYEKARMSDIKLRVRGIDLLNRVSQASSPAMRDMRAMGLNALYNMGPVRKTLMQMGLGVSEKAG